MRVDILACQEEIGAAPQVDNRLDQIGNLLVADRILVFDVAWAGPRTGGEQRNDASRG